MGSLGMNSLRGSIDIKEDMAFLELLWVRTRLEMLLEGVLADMVGPDGGDGRGVDEGIFGALSSHVMRGWRRVVYC